MDVLGIDLETFSTIPIETGVHKYVTCPQFKILLFSYKLNDEPTRCVDLARGEKIPARILRMLPDPNVIKTAYGATFERRCLSKELDIDLDAAQWECTMVKGGYAGLPMNLDSVGKALNLATKKDPEGKKWLKYFCTPCKPTKVNGGRSRNLPEHNPEGWIAFKSYNITDVDVEYGVRKCLGWITIPEMERRLYVLDQKINDRGIRVDRKMIRRAMRKDVMYGKRMKARATEITGLSNANSPIQLTKWLNERTGLGITTLKADALPGLIEKCKDRVAKQVIEIRQQMSSTSVKKYRKMYNCLLNDDHVRGGLQFYGAMRTGRWAGRMFQPHNFPKNSMEDLDLARRAVRGADLDTLEMLFDDIPYVLKQLLRTSFIADPDHLLACADFSQIEARVIAWLAGEKWRIDTFKKGTDIYLASVSKMFNIPLETLTKKSPERHKGKIAELALGFGGSVEAMIRMGALKMGLQRKELKSIVNAWRRANAKIVKLWKDVQTAAITAVRDGVVTRAAHCKFYTRKGYLIIKLPSGRKLHYLSPQITKDRWGRDALCYMGVNQETKQWMKIDTYGGKLVENIVQAIARDLLCEKMLDLDDNGFDIAFHVHDEAILQVPKLNSANVLDEINRLMREPIEWAEGLPLDADAFLTPYYKKED